MLIGYARVSTVEKNLDLQIDALEKSGYTQIFADKASGARVDRPELLKALDACQAGSTLVVWQLDRLGRSLQHLIETVTGLNERGVGFKTCCDGVDTTTSGGRLVFHIFAVTCPGETGPPLVLRGGPVSPGQVSFSARALNHKSVVGGIVLNSNIASSFVRHGGGEISRGTTGCGLKGAGKVP